MLRSLRLSGKDAGETPDSEDTDDGASLISVPGSSSQLLLEQIGELEMKQASVLADLEQVEALWKKRRQPLLDEIQSLEAEQERLKEEELRWMQAAENSAPPAPGPPCLSWVDSTWFTCLCNLVVALNLAYMVGASRLEHAHLSLFPVCLDQLFLAWYALELAARACYHQRNLFVGSCSRVWWSWLDLGIVLSGALDQWLLPLLVPASRLDALSFVGALRIFRVLRVLRLLRAFWLSDFSWTERPFFGAFMAGVIAVNSLTMWLELDYNWPIWPYVENVFLIIYTFELVVRIRYLGCEFFMDKNTVVFNTLDLIMVAGGALDRWLLPAVAFIQSALSGGSQGQNPRTSSEVLTILKMMRLLRVLRLVRLLRTIKPLYQLLTGIIEALMAMQYVMVLTVLVLYAGAITWTTLIGHGLLTGHSEEEEEDEKYFKSVPESLFSLFKLMNGDTSVVERVTRTPFGQLMFAAFTVLSNWAVLAILTSVVSDNMASSSAKAAQEDAELQKQTEQAMRAERILGLFRDVDSDGSGAITTEECRAMLDDRVRCDRLQDATKLSHRAIEFIFEYLEQPNNLSVGRLAGYRGKIIMYEDFLSHVDDSAVPADRRSLMHLTAQVHNLQRKVAEGKHPFVN